MTLAEAVLSGFLQATAPSVLPWLAIGALFGLVVGVIPGLSGHFAMAMAVTFLHAMEPATGIVFLLAAHATVAQGGGLTAILFSTPGTGQNAATLLDGPKMRDRGQAGVAVGAAMTACFLGAAFGAVVLAVLIPVLREVVLLFGPPEIFALAILGLVFVAVLGRRDMARSLIAGLLGLMLAMVGSSGVDWTPRLTFGAERLADGLPLVPVILGLFAVAEMIALWRRGGSLAGAAARPASPAETQAQIFRGAGLALRRWPLVLRASSIGAAIGVIPGLGSSVAAFVAYGHARQMAKDPDSFGSGNVDGVIAPEAANDAVEGGALASTVAFGIPGSSSMAILLSGLSILGLQTGPAMLDEGVDIVFVMIFTIVLGNLIGTVCGMALVNPLVRATSVRATLAAPVLLAVILTGAYAGDRVLLDMGIALVFGVLGYVCSLLRYSRAALLIGFVLGGVVDRNLNLSLQLDGPLFLFHGLALPLAAVTLVFLAWSALRSRRAGAATGPTGKVSPDRTADPDDRADLLAIETLLLAAILAAAAFAFVDLAGRSLSAARTPLVILAPLVALSLAQLLRARRARAGGGTGRRIARALSGRLDGFTVVARLVATLAGFVAVAAALGHHVGVLALVFVMTGRLGGERPAVAAAAAILAAAAIHVVFELGFGVETYRGLIPRALSGYRDF